MFLLQPSPNHTPLKYGCLFKKSNEFNTHILEKGMFTLVTNDYDDRFLIDWEIGGGLSLFYKKSLKLRVTMSKMDEKVTRNLTFS